MVVPHAAGHALNPISNSNENIYIRYRQHFQEVPGLEKMVGSVWELVNRRDMSLPGSKDQPRANIVAAIVPGERLRFQDSTVACSTAAGESAGRRSWELTKEGEHVMLTIYQLKDKVGHYDAIRFRVDKLDKMPGCTSMRRRGSMRSRWRGIHHRT